MELEKNNMQRIKYFVLVGVDGYDIFAEGFFTIAEAIEFLNSQAKRKEVYLTVLTQKISYTDRR